LPNPQGIKALPKIYDAIYSGTVSALRGIYEIVHAVYFIKQYRSAIKVIVIGGFNSERLKHRILSLIKKYNLADNLIIHPPVPFEEISSFYSNSKIGLCLFHPIKLYKNAVFIKTFEYMAFGLPVIGSNFGNIAHYIESADAGITVDFLQPAAIGNAIIKILDSHGLYEKYSNNGVSAVREKYNWQSEESKLLGFYQKMLVTA
jgi:glycosyltransferase involved in cell wall biosynthesis